MGSGWPGASGSDHPSSGETQAVALPMDAGDRRAGEDLIDGGGTTTRTHLHRLRNHSLGTSKPSLRQPAWPQQCDTPAQAIQKRNFDLSQKSATSRLQLNVEQCINRIAPEK